MTDDGWEHIKAGKTQGSTPEAVLVKTFAQSWSLLGSRLWSELVEYLNSQVASPELLHSIGFDVMMSVNETAVCKLEVITELALKREPADE